MGGRTARATSPEAIRMTSRRFVCLLAPLIALGLMAATPSLAARDQVFGLLDQVKANSQFSVFARALEATSYGERLRDGGPFTVFAFTDHAFERLPASFRELLFSSTGKAKLEKLMAYHVIPGRSASSDLFGQIQTVKSVAGYPITIEGHLKFIRVNGSTILQSDIPATNGVIHLLDYVIIPPDF
jgi:uncharacterized surface protein with fasciclin (FAS1) repeats